MSDYIYPYSAFAAGVLSVDEFKSELVKLLREQPEQSDATLDHLRVLVREGLLSDKHYIDLRKVTEIEAAKAAFAIAKYADLTDPDATQIHTQNVTPISSAKPVSKRKLPPASLQASEDETLASAPPVTPLQEREDWGSQPITREEDIPAPDAGHFPVDDFDSIAAADTPTLIHGADDDATLIGAHISDMSGDETLTSASNVSALNTTEDPDAATIITGADATMLTQESNAGEPETIKTSALDPLTANSSTAEDQSYYEVNDSEQTTPRGSELSDSTRPVLKPSKSLTSYTESALPPPPNQEERLTAVDTMLTAQHTAQRFSNFLEKENIRFDKKDFIAGGLAIVVISLLLYFSTDLMPFIGGLDPTMEAKLPQQKIEKNVGNQTNSDVQKQVDKRPETNTPQLSNTDEYASFGTDQGSETQTDITTKLSSTGNLNDDIHRKEVPDARPSESVNDYQDTSSSPTNQESYTASLQTRPSTDTGNNSSANIHKPSEGQRTPAFRINNPTQLYRFLIAATEVGELEPLSDSTSALAYLEKLERTPGAEDFARSGRAEVARAYLELAKAAREVGRWAEAESYVEKAVELRIKQKSLSQ